MFSTYFDGEPTLKRLQTVGSFPTPPLLDFFYKYSGGNSFIFQVWIGFVYGTKKVMGWFISVKQGQSPGEIWLLAEAHVIIESFKDLLRVFGPFISQLQSLMDSCICVTP